MLYSRTSYWKYVEFLKFRKIDKSYFVMIYALLSNILYTHFRLHHNAVICVGVYQDGEDVMDQTQFTFTSHIPVKKCPK